MKRVVFYVGTYLVIANRAVYKCLLMMMMMMMMNRWAVGFDITTDKLF